MKLRRRSRALACALAGCMVGTTLLGLAWFGTLRAAASSGPPGGVNVEPSMRPWRYVGANPQSWWCQPPNCTSDFSNPVATATSEMRYAKSLGAQNIRLEIPWPLIETSSGVYDWSRADALFQAASQAGITIEPDLMWTPQWAGGGSMLTDPPSAGDMQAFAQAFVQRYDPVLKRGVEVWNEEDGSKYFTGSASTYVSRILNPAYAGIKAADPSIPVILGGTGTDTAGSFLQSVISAGGQFDIAAFHNYVGSALSEAQTYASVLNSSGRSSTPIWLGEYGSESGTSSQVTLIDQVLGQSSPLAMAQWYNLRDTDSWSCCPPVDVAQGTWGLLTSGFTAKASFATMQGYLSGRSAPPPPAWSAPPSSAPASTSPGGGTEPSVTASPSGEANPTATASPSPSPSPSAYSPSPSSTPALSNTPSLPIVSATTTGSPRRPLGGTPWGLIATAGAIVLLLGSGAAVWLAPGLRRRLLPLRR